MVINLLTTILSTIILILQGECDFSRLKIAGPYQVGYREFRTRIYDNEVSIFYPIDKGCYKRLIKKRNTL